MAQFSPRQFLCIKHVTCFEKPAHVLENPNKSSRVPRTSCRGKYKMKASCPQLTDLPSQTSEAQRFAGLNDFFCCRYRPPVESSCGNGWVALGNPSLSFPAHPPASGHSSLSNQKVDHQNTHCHSQLIYMHSIKKK